MSITKQLSFILVVFLSFTMTPKQALASDFTMDEIPWNCEWDLFNNLGEYWMTITYSREGNKVIGQIKNSLTRHNLTFVSDMNNEIHFSGTWSQSETGYGELRIRFTSPTTLQASYNHQVAKDRWGKFNGSTNCARVPKSTNFNTIPWNCVWWTSYGNMQWSKNGNDVIGVYNEKSKKDVRGHLEIEDGIIVLKGHYYKDGVKSGEIKFSFTDNSSFTGGYKKHGKWENWHGSTECSQRAKTTVDVQPKKERIAKSAMAWHCPWKTTYGEIIWRLDGNYVVGVYDIKLNKEIRGYLENDEGELKLIGDAYQNGVKSTPVTLTFKTPTSFSGGYKQWGMWQGWHGDATCGSK